MSVMGILAAAAVVGVTGIFVGLFLGAAGIKFKVEVDEKEEAVLAALLAMTEALYPRRELVCASAQGVPAWRQPSPKGRLW